MNETNRDYAMQLITAQYLLGHRLDPHFPWLGTFHFPLPRADHWPFPRPPPRQRFS